MATDLVLYEGKNGLGFDSTISVRLADLKKLSNSINIVEGRDIEFNRKILENKNVDILLNPEKATYKDSLHHRNSGLDQVLCSIANRNGIAIGFSFNEILNAKSRYKTLGRMMQNIRLCRKYKVNIVFATFAKNKWELRSKSDLESFAKVLGMNGKESKECFTNIDIIIKKEHKKKSVKVL